jgi:hypothetical protein
MTSFSPPVSQARHVLDDILNDQEALREQNNDLRARLLAVESQVRSRTRLGQHDQGDVCSRGKMTKAKRGRIRRTRPRRSDDENDRLGTSDHEDNSSEYEDLGLTRTKLLVPATKAKVYLQVPIPRDLADVNLIACRGRSMPNFGSYAVFRKARLGLPI